MCTLQTEVANDEDQDANGADANLRAEKDALQSVLPLLWSESVQVLLKACHRYRSFQLSSFHLSCYLQQENGSQLVEHVSG